MKNFLYRTLLSALIILFTAEGSLAIPYRLRKIERLYFQKKYEEAINELGKALGSMSGSDYLEGRMMMALLEKDIQRSIRIYTTVANSGQRSVAFKARNELAKIYYSTGEYEKAVKMIELIPESAESGLFMEALYFRGLSLKLLGDIERARRDFRSIEKGDYLYRSYMELAELDMQTGEYGAAIEKYEAIGGIHSNPIAIFKLGECYEITGDLEKAFDTYRSLEKLFPKSLESPKARDKMRMISSMSEDEPLNDRGGGELIEAAGDKRYESVIETRIHTIQFGAFHERKNAVRLSKDLASIFPDVRIETVIMESGTELYRVRVGRYADRGSAEDDSLMAADKYGYSGKILTIE